MMAGVAPAFERAPNHRPPCWRPARGIKRNTDMADVRTARRNAEKAAGRHAGGAAGELGVARANQQEATAVVDVAAEKGRQLVEAAQLGRPAGPPAEGLRRRGSPGAHSSGTRATAGTAPGPARPSWRSAGTPGQRGTAPPSYAVNARKRDYPNAYSFPSELPT